MLLPCHGLPAFVLGAILLFCLGDKELADGEPLLRTPRGRLFIESTRRPLQPSSRFLEQTTRTLDSGTGTCAENLHCVDAGYYIVYGCGYCSRCPSGSVTRGYDNLYDMCYPCPAGQTTTDFVNCYDPKAPTMMPTPVPCPQGQFSTDGWNCRLCPAGQTSPSGSTACSNCPAGKFSNAGAAACTDCVAGYYSAAGTGGSTAAAACTLCPTDSTSVRCVHFQHIQSVTLSD